MAATAQVLISEIEHAPDEGRRILGSPGSEPLDAVSWLSAHLGAVEHTVRPMAERRLPDGPARIERQRALARELEQLLRLYERRTTGDVQATGVDGDELRRALADDLDLYIDEERGLLTDLATQLTDEEARDLCTRYERALHHAPTRPHPAAPHSGPLARVATAVNATRDRIRELLDAHDGGPVNPPPPPRRLGRWGRYLSGNVEFDEDQE